MVVGRLVQQTLLLIDQSFYPLRLLLAQEWVSMTQYLNSISLTSLDILQESISMMTSRIVKVRNTHGVLEREHTSSAGSP